MLKRPEIHPITDIHLPEAEVSTLSRGIRLCCVPGTDAGVVKLRIVWQGGEMECRLPQVAQIAAMLMPEATEKYPDGAPLRIMDFNGAKLNITSSNHSTVLTVTALATKLPEVLVVVEDIICHPLLEEHTFALMRDITAMRLATAMVDVDTRSSMLLRRLMRGYGYSGSVDVTPEQVRQISGEEVNRFITSTFHTGTGIIALLSGDYNDECRRKVEKMLQRLPAQPQREHQLQPFAPEAAGIYTVEVENAVQAGIHMGLPVPSAWETVGVDVRNTICALGGYFGSRLMKNIREDKGYTYGIQAFMLNNPEGTSMCISVQTGQGTVEPVIEETRREIQRLAENPPEGNELECLRQNLALGLAAIVDTPFAIADEYMRMLTGLIPCDFFRRRAESLITLSPEVISRTAASFLHSEKLRIAIAR